MLGHLFDKVMGLAMLYVSMVVKFWPPQWQISYIAFKIEVTLLDMGIMGETTVAKGLEPLYEDVKKWCKAAGENLHAVHFTATIFGLASKADFPQACLVWLLQRSPFGDFALKCEVKLCIY